MSEQTHLTVGPNESGNEELGMILEQFRINAQLTRAQAADILGFSSEYVRLIERGTRVPALGTMKNLLNAYKISHKIGVDYASFGSYFVEFTSRIRESRITVPQYKVETRNERIGEIVSILATSDDATLLEVYRVLRRVNRSRGTHPHTELTSNGGSAQ
jgi:transcriptional regulator with XRE-family HTH domain